MKKFTPLPDRYTEPAKQAGKVIRLEYKKGDFTKHCFVYLPYGYDENKKYNVLYTLHGGEGNLEAYLGNETEPSPIKHCFDNMIENGDIEPIIVVSPTYYDQVSFAGQVAKAADAVFAFNKEIRENLIPAVEGTFSTYAESTDEEEIVKTRKHRAFSGFSMGSLATWYTYINNLDEFFYFMPFSGDCWVNGARDKNIEGNAEAAAIILDEIPEKFGYSSKDFFIHAVTGDKDIAYGPMCNLIDALQKNAPAFVFTDEGENEGNIRWQVQEEAYHSYEYAPLYFYNVLPGFWK